jgi:uncharacterized protein YjbJ (UPF0337 family)
MSNASKRGEGAAKELGGKLEKGFGKLVGSHPLEDEGRAREREGKAQQEAAKAAERTKGRVEEIAGSVKNRVGALLDDEALEAEGKATELKGQARQKTNRQSGKIGWAILWLLGVPLPVLLLIYLLRGH